MKIKRDNQNVPDYGESRDELEEVQQEQNREKTINQILSEDGKYLPSYCPLVLTKGDGR
jgi:hypothetical protein